ncbi:probable E3 ubiquitin-protein ligase sinah [Pollicipes pollicipes]|uniref:probable E3 ubiquitin-protein ligase sinah n=1 Tax=Pollicipes pollicipes TaxID=41117 RepID=UPI0018851D36|nr:probable E3 ubiquitin-protein ligase sinah [Pollicipes pollicipes]XP_037078591.1 probable E3 ubiquitin-protein ligase sinah [Pollicipes pollicipes]XP_037086153.1 probable E3 ubiquitin-protein ligase sinah [Pollicipes pollicipes]XP_037086160.1 probable E3 ubiquitin-protein ligase sinah [Pollicipes pollicipes]XP_037086168.1 probable E3 ubiquitin-protein ligase sinah [Pollicipes pollicipes]XP_037091274.1 probable E3 ubiquitin-protein ligase sinah [Pollicipes pollicipes]
MSKNGVLAKEPVSDGAVDYQRLIQLFECPVCHEYMRPPIHQCKKGHVICQKCRPKVKGICPLCKQLVANQTNLMMEKISTLIKFPCVYAPKGCDELVPLREKSHHETTCARRPVHCEYARRGCGALLPLRDMTGHVRQCHFRPA